MTRTWIAIAAATLVVACGDGMPDVGGPATDDLDGSAVWRVEEVVRIGSVDDPGASLVRVGDVRLGPDGHVYIEQASDDQLRVYGADGSLVRTIGRSGEGPGEFGSISGLGFVGDTLYVSDSGNSRLHYFALDGTFLTSDPWPSRVLRGGAGMAFLTSPPQVLLSDGSGLMSPLAAVMAADRQPAGPRTASSERMLFRVRRDPATLDTLVVTERTARSNTAPADGRDIRFFCPFDANPIATLMVDGSGVVVVGRGSSPGGPSTTFPVTLVDPSGDTAFRSTPSYEPVPVTEPMVRREVEEIRAPLVEDDRPAPSAPEIEAALREIDCVPPSLSPVADVVTAQDGTIWIRMSDDGQGPTSTWRVLDGRGTEVGVLELPAEETVVAATGDVLVTTEVDELDVPFVTRYTLVR